ncbi:MAG: hypothetical protein GY699_21970 [Desulfobacteraceae bacterium]|nr:hypothetical protein [Desulfobacteraceae bacterium]
MKIDTSYINLSSNRTFSEKNQVKLEKEMKFLDLLDQGVHKFNAAASYQQLNVGFTSKWFTVTSFQQQDAIELSRQFFNELEKMRQILDRILERLNSTGLKGCCLQLSALDRVNISPFFQQSVKMLEYNYQEKRTYTHEEKEETDFFADGIVKTMDGRSIDFSFQMDLEREFFKEDQFVYSEKGYVMVDPLIINLDATIPQFSETRMSFDLDLDGEKEDIPLLKQGSGLLSLDKNNDGIINDGSELFGPSTGDGFGELSQYDLDKNFWIDENDAIFDELTLWENDDQGEMQLTKIKDAGVGAIYLMNAPTPFDLRDEDNHLQARIKKSGIALNEDGSVSSIQEMDWTA